MFDRDDWTVRPGLVNSITARQRWSGLLLAALVGGLFGRYVLAGWVGWSPGRSAQPRAVAPRGDLNSSEQATIGLFERVSPSVVYISTSALQRDVFTLNATEAPRGTGSGFLWDTDGHVVTNFHVIANAYRARITLHDNTSYMATLVGAAPDKDVAVLKIDAPPTRLRPIPIGISRDLRVGQSVFAIGNPFGLDYTLTTGVVSALNREIQSLSGRTIQGVIQTDAAINPGNSGGPLLDSAGRLIGINAAIKSPSGSSAGIGFAVPVDTVNRVVPQLIAYGKVVRPGLGVAMLNDPKAQQLGLKGVGVFTVRPNSAAAKAGLRGYEETRDGKAKLEIILRVGDKVTRNQDELLNALEQYEIGAKAELTICTVELPSLREGPKRKVMVTLQQVE